jgi:hypothetical protein
MSKVFIVIFKSLKSIKNVVKETPIIINTTGIENIQSTSITMEGYMLHMLKVQKLMVDQFDVKARSNDALASIGDLTKKLGSGNSVEND